LTRKFSQFPIIAEPVSEDTRALVADDPFVGAELRERLEIAGMSNAPPPGIIVEAASYKIGSNSLKI
jgi:hypothetical protein